jgi:ABC-type antimicrobial peptide transport system permease subunit
VTSGPPPLFYRLFTRADWVALVGAGVVLGLVFSLFATVFAGRVLAGTALPDGGRLPLDLVTVAVVALVLAIVGTAAAWLPARRATRLDPINVLRHD